LASQTRRSSHETPRIWQEGTATAAGSEGTATGAGDAAPGRLARHPGGECPICLSTEVASPVQTNCGHWFCARSVSRPCRPLSPVGPRGVSESQLVPCSSQLGVLFKACKCGSLCSSGHLIFDAEARPRPRSNTHPRAPAFGEQRVHTHPLPDVRQRLKSRAWRRLVPTSFARSRCILGYYDGLRRAKIKCPLCRQEVSRQVISALQGTRAAQDQQQSACPRRTRTARYRARHNGTLCTFCRERLHVNSHALESLLHKHLYSQVVAPRPTVGDPFTR